MSQTSYTSQISSSAASTNHSQSIFKDDQASDSSGLRESPPTSQSQPEQDTQRSYGPYYSDKREGRPLDTRLNTSLRNSSSRSGPSTPISGASASPTRGSKRTANGVLKSPTSATSPMYKGHARNASRDSVNSSVSELSVQLRTRLSHAMSKISTSQEAWASRDLASLSSRRSSPGPRTNGRVGYNDSAVDLPHSTLVGGSRATRDLSDVISRSSNGQPMLGTPPSIMANQSSVPALAPAPELKPSSRARSSSNPYHQVGFSNGMPPTQQEQEAVDTLLFMSSPANSERYRKRGPFDGSPARPVTQYSSRHRHTTSLNSHATGLASIPFPLGGMRREDSGSSYNSSRGNGSLSNDALDAHRRKRRSTGPLMSGAEVEQLLDDLNESSADEMDGHVLRGHAG